MVQIAIRATVDAAIDVLLEKKKEAWQLLKLPTGLMFVAYSILEVMPYIQNDIVDLALPFWIVYGLLSSAATVLIGYKWQKFILLNTPHKLEGVETNSIINYTRYWCLMYLPLFAMQVGIGYASFYGAGVGYAVLPMVVVSILYLPVLKRAALSLSAAAANYEGLSLKDAYLLGKGNGWRMVFAAIWAGIYLGLVMLIIGVILMLVLMLFGWIFSGVLGAESIYLTVLPLLVLKVTAMTIGLIVQAGVEAFSFTQLQPEFHSVWEKQKELAAARNEAANEQGTVDGAKPSGPSYGQRKGA